jgi:M3 family oligoendopeptidase
MEKFAQIPYQRPDLEALKRQSLSLIERLEQAGQPAEARQALLDLDGLEKTADTAITIAHVRNTIDTTDAFYEAEVTYFNETLPTLIPLRIRLLKALLACPFRHELESEFGNQILINAETELKVQDEAIMAEKVEEANLCQAYQKLTALCTTTFRGESVNFYGLLKHMEHQDRAHRREAYLAWADLYAAHADQLDGLYDQLIAVRVRMADKMGYNRYTELAYLNRNRTAYGPEDVARFRGQVLEIIVPACAKIRVDQAKRIGIDTLKYFDEALLFADGNPEPAGNKDQMVAWAKEMYRELSPETGVFFDFMAQYELFDLETRPGKRMGGYCTSLTGLKAPFIFANFNGTSADVDVLTHEAGHAFAYYTASRVQPLAEYCHSTSEINEIHSMTMEHFTYPWMEIFFGVQAEQYRYAHLCQALNILPYMMCVDEFQHLVFDRPTMSAQERRRAWRDLEHTYMPWRDYDGVPFLEEGGFWMQKQHIFLYPFYYIDYALAQMGAFELYGRMKTDRPIAWSDYLALCKAGGSRGYLDLLSLARLANPFAEGGVARAVAHVVEEVSDSAFRSLRAIGKGA